MTDEDLGQDFQTNSTVIDTDIDGVKSGGGKVAPEAKEEPRKPETARDSLEAEFKKLSSKPKENDEENPSTETPGKETVAKVEKPEKPEKQETPELKENKDSAKAEGVEQEAKTPKPSEGRRIEAPARFLPQARDLWRNVPNVVQQEWARVEKEREEEISHYREAKTFRDELSEYDNMAKQSGTTLKQALNQYIGMENAFRGDPAQGFQALMKNLQMHPAQAIGHIMRAANVTPQQLMEHMQREPHAYTSLARQPVNQQMQPAQRQPDPEVAALRQEVDRIRSEQATQQVITPFLNEHPGAAEVWPAIEEVILSGILDKIHGGGLSPRDKLERALAMVSPEIWNSRGQGRQESSDSSSASNETPAADLQGGKSVRSSPGSVTDITEAPKKMEIRDMLEDELKRIQRRA